MIASFYSQPNTVCRAAGATAAAVAQRVRLVCGAMTGASLQTFGAGKYFIISDGTTRRQFFFSTGTETEGDPAPGVETVSTINVNVGDTAAQVAAAVLFNLTDVLEFTDDGSSGSTLIVVDDATGARAHVDAGDCGIVMTILRAGSPSALAAPTGLAATAGDAEVALIWTRPDSVVGLNWWVWRNTVNTFASATPIAFVNVATNASPPQPSPAYIDATAVNSTTYYYWVTLTDGSDESDPSTSISATPAASGGSFLTTEGGKPITTEARTPIIPEI